MNAAPILTRGELACDGVVCARQPCAGCPVCAGTDRPTTVPVPPSDDRAALVRWDLADTATFHGMRCVARLCVTAVSRDEWDMIALDFGTAHSRSGDSQARRVLFAAVEAAELMAVSEPSVAVARLAECCHETPDEWLASKRTERTESRS